MHVHFEITAVDEFIIESIIRTMQLSKEVLYLSKEVVFQIQWI